MKKTISILLVTSSFWVMTLNKVIAQDTIPSEQSNNCNSCKAKKSTDHDINEKDAAKMIKKFKRKFSVITYGGTIYGSEQYFNEIPNSTEKKSTMIRYHFCSDATDSRNLFLAFEKAECIQSSRDTNLYFAQEKIPGECRKSNEQIFDKIKPKLLVSFRKFKTRLRNYNKPYSYVYNTPESQIISAEDVKTSREYLKNNTYFEKHIQCTLNGGNFNFEYSIHDIYQKAIAAGKICVGIRYYFGYVKNTNNNINFAESGNEIRILIVGVDEDGNNLMIWKENSFGQ